MSAAGRSSNVRALFVLCVALIAGTGRVPAQSTTTVPDADVAAIVARAGRYMETFEQQFSAVVCEELQVQHLIQPDGKVHQTRELKSDFLLVKTGASWMQQPFRDVIEVDRRPVRNRDDRLRKLFLEGSRTAVEQARAVTKETGRYNIGTNRVGVSPLLPLRVLHPQLAPGFRFTRAGTALRFSEVHTPTYLSYSRNGTRGDLPSTGSFEVDASGKVLAAEIGADGSAGLVAFKFTVRYRDDPTLNLMVPVDMKEEYWRPDRPKDDRLVVTSAYGTFRRFQVQTSETVKVQSGNPILPGWYADPEAHVFANEYWIYPTYSAPYGEQTFLDAFSSSDLLTWTKHPRILDTTQVKWATRAVWAPSIVEGPPQRPGMPGLYYLFFGANDIQNDNQIGGIGVARASQPGGPFVDHLGKPLVDRFHNGAQPIDPFVFKDTDGTFYLIYGGWRHCNIAKLNADFTGFVPFPDGTTFKEITPEGYVEGSFMFVKDGKYYFMWSEGGWTGPNYAVAYAIGRSPLGPFERAGKILQQDPSVATGAGHHSVLHVPGSDHWYIVYHRRPLGETDRNHRVVCIDELKFDATGAILPVVITKDGVAAEPVRR